MVVGRGGCGYARVALDEANAGEDVFIDWLLHAYSGTLEIHDVTPQDQASQPLAPRLLVAVNEDVQGPRLIKREELVPHHLWVVPPALWEQVRAGQAALPDGFERVPARSWRRTPRHEDSSTSVRQVLLTNFRCFEQTRFSFGAGMNVLIGQNGAGKTTVLDALAMGLASVVRPLFHTLDAVFPELSLRVQDIRVARIDKGGTTTFEPQYPSRIDVHMDAFGQQLEAGPFTYRHESGAGLIGHSQSNLLMNAPFVVDWAVQDGFDVTLPLIAYYGTGRTWQGGQERASTRDDLSRLAGYEGCLEPSIQLSSMRAWFRRMELLALQDGRTPPVLEASKRAMLACLDGFDLVRYDARLDDLAARSVETGLLLGFEQLSDGQRNMLGMVADMAYRAATLNPHLGPDAALKTPGVVLIDELDLHLHPAWQRRVVGDLRRAFPRVQFIATTHSPQVLSSVRRDEVVHLHRGASVASKEFVEGRDSNSLLEDVFGVPARPADMQERLRGVFTAIDDERYEDAARDLAAAEAMLGPSDPDVIRARWMLDREAADRAALPQG